MDQKIFNRISCGLYILTASLNGKDSGCIINTLMQTAFDPVSVSICVNKANYTCELIQKSKKFTVSLLNTDTAFDTIKHFGFQSGRDTDKFAGFRGCIRTLNGTYAVTQGTNSYICASVTQQIDLGSHIMFIGTPSDGVILNDVPSLTYSYYHEYLKPEPQAAVKATEGQTIWRCTVCGYEYAGEELPENFTCPVCKHPASDFERIN